MPLPDAITCPAPTQPSPTPDEQRAAAYAAFLARRDGLRDGRPSSQAVAALLERLSSRGCLAVDPAPAGFRASFVAGPDTAAAFAREAVPHWSPGVLKRIAKGARTTPGALFDFPFEAGAGTVQVFITDWSPCPVACAVALHRHHPASGGVREGFTGRFVRHPLTGDLLPLWVADWVKPTFGTGAVLVNPAHDRMDLAYARRTGFPIRFGLAARDAEPAPASWPVPPVIKAGLTTKTGAYDGLEIGEAMRTFFAVIEGRGFARRHDDVRLEVAPLAEIEPDPDGALAYDDATGRMSASGPGPRFRVSPTAALELAASAAARDGGTLRLVLTAAHQRDTLPVLAPVLHEDGVAAPPQVVALGSVEATAFVDQPQADVAVHVAARPDQPAVVRQQNLDQVRRFIERHAALAGPRSARGEAPDVALARPVRSALRAGDAAAAFKALAAVQKGLCEDPSPPDLLAAYRDDAWTLLGLD